MQFNEEESEQFLKEEFQRASHSLRLRQYCEEIHGHPINIRITSFRHHYIVTGKVNDIPFRESVPKSSEFLDQPVVFQIEQEHTEENDLSEQDETVPLATCCGCDAVGQLGHLCTESECLDSGNIYADLITPARTTAFDQRHFEATGEYRESS